MPEVPASEEAPEAGPERLVGREFSEMRLGMLMRMGGKEAVKLYWMPVDDDIEGDVRVFSGKITGMERKVRLDTNAFKFERTDLGEPSPDAAVTVENYLILADEDISDFEARLD